MTPTQFQIVMDKFDSLESRLRRVERFVGLLTGAIILLAFLINADIVSIGGADGGIQATK